MDTNNNVAEPVETKKAKRSSVTLTAGEGATASRLTILARRTRGDRGETVVTLTDAKKKNVRGMTSKHDTFEAAVDALRKLEADAVKKGWKRAERKGGFQARPDAFDAIPAAPKVSK